MAKVRGPLMSLDASGTLAGEVRFRHQSGHVLVYRDGAPGSVDRKGPTAAQQAQRELYAEAVTRWRELAAEFRAEWVAYAAAQGKGLTPWNLFLSCVLRGGDCDSPYGPLLPDPWTYVPPVGNAILYPDILWVPDTPYTPPPGHLVI